MTPYYFHINPTDIHINPKIISRLMGIETEIIPEPYNEFIETEIREISGYQNIKGGYVISDKIEIDPSGETFVFEGEKFMAGKQVVNYLKKSEQLALFTCTAGEEVSIRSKRLMASGNLLEGYITDLFGSVIVEEAMSIIHEKITADLAAKGLKTTNRYSPGYCEWNVVEQHKLFGFFPAGFCGVRLTDSALMSPIKSVSGVIGIGKDVRFHKYVCNECTNLNCIYRNLKYVI